MPGVSAADSTAPRFWQSPHGRALPAPGGRTLLMGVLNLTPDSFSDGGELPTTQAVVERAGAMLAAGADVLDLGGESTRPHAAPLDANAELDRVLPALTAVRAAFPRAPLSIDTYKPAVAAAAIRAGADIINDVWGALHGWPSAQRQEALKQLQLSTNASTDTIPTPSAPLRLCASSSSPLPNSSRPLRSSVQSDFLSFPSPMAQTAAALACPLILMHNRPDRAYHDFWPDLLADLHLSLAVARAAGMPDHQLWLDPGFGFAKEPAQNLEIVKHLARVVALGYPVLLGPSRKSTIGQVLDTPVHDRLDGTGAILVWAIQQGCAMARVHDLAPMRRYLQMADALKAGLAYR